MTSLTSFRFSLTMVVALLAGVATAQPRFTILHSVPATSVKDQHHTGTCWCFATISFLESEMIRSGAENPDLSEMFFVRRAYEEKADKYVRMHGTVNFGQGGLAMDVLHLWKKFGALPQEAYESGIYGGALPDHNEMDVLLRSYVEQVNRAPGGTLTPVWKDGFTGILDSYLGPLPGAPGYEGEPVDPVAYASGTGLDPGAYVAIGSYTHHPFYAEFPIEIPDNWLWSKIHNVPLDELMEVLDHALEHGYSACWDADVGDIGFGWKAGLAMMPVYDPGALDESVKTTWDRLTPRQQRKEFYDFFEPGMEVSISQEVRQKRFDDRRTTDDHLMHITGLAMDQDGKHFYRVKNSWGADGHIHDGYFYASENYMRAQTIFLLVHRSALPAHIAEKLGL